MPKNVPALVSAAMMEASTAHHGMRAPAKGEVFEVLLLPAHVEADEDDDEEVEKKDSGIDQQTRIHGGYLATDASEETWNSGSILTQE